MDVLTASFGAHTYPDLDATAHVEFELMNALLNFVVFALSPSLKMAVAATLAATDNKIARCIQRSL